MAGSMEISKLNAMRQQLTSEIARLENEKALLINDIHLTKDRKRKIESEIENLIREKGKVAGEYQQVKEKTDKLLSEVEEEKRELKQEQSKSLEEIGKKLAEVQKMKLNVEKENKENTKKIELAKDQLKANLTSAFNSLIKTLNEVNSSLDVIKSIIASL